ncbi:MAG: serine/threonine-protein kinase [Polyangiaceae bacterium]
MGVGPGEVIAGKYRVERVLGEGGMGIVVAARHVQLGQLYALKFMREDVMTAEYKSRFLREARNTVRLKSKHVSRVFDVGSLESGAPYMVLEYLEGTDLSALLQQRGPLPVHEVCEYVVQACEAIAEAHSHGIVHRDLKPANVFLTRGTQGEPIVKVLDFGVSKVQDLGLSSSGGDDTRPGGSAPDSVVTRASDLLGSPSYMAPEQVISARDADTQSDIWSIGVILYRLTTGKAPFQAQSLGELIQSIMHGTIPSPREHRPDLPAGFEHVVMRCLEKDRERRWPDVVELSRALAPFTTPVANPSVERIALLGPALPVAPPAPNVTQTHNAGSAPSYPSGAVWARGAHATGPSRAVPAEVSRGGMVLRGLALFVVVAGITFAIGTQWMKSRGARGAQQPPVAAQPEPPATALPPSATPSPTAPTGIPAPPAPPAATVLAAPNRLGPSKPGAAKPRPGPRPTAPPDPPKASSTSTAPTAPAPTAPAPTATPAAPTATAGGDIPATRD